MRSKYFLTTHSWVITDLFPYGQITKSKGAVKTSDISLTQRLWNDQDQAGESSSHSAYVHLISDAARGDVPG